MLAELVLTLFDADGCALAHLDHVIRMLLAETALLAFHAGDVVAVDARVHGRAQLEFAQKPAKRCSQRRRLKGNGLRGACPEGNDAK